MKKRWLVFLSLIPGLTWSWAAEKDQARLKLPWDVLQKVMKLDSPQVRLSWPEFQTLLRHTQPKDLPVFSLSGGSVVMAPEEFRRLIQSLAPPPPQAPTVSVSKAFYQGRLQGESAEISATLQVHVRKKSAKPLRLDLFPGNLAFQEILLDGQPALAEQENGRLYVTTDRTGDFTVRLIFAVKAPEARSVQQLSIPVARTPITEWELEIPQKRLDIRVDPALQAETQDTVDGTRVRALLPPTQWITTAWNLAAPDQGKEPAKVYADSSHLMSIEEDAVRVQSRIQLQILQNTVKSLSLQIPKGFDVLDVQGDSLGPWTEKGAGEARTLEIPLLYARKGSFSLAVTLEQVLTENKAAPAFTGLPVRNAVREKGFVAVELKTSAEIPAPALQGLERVDIQELPADMITLSRRPLLYGYRYLRPPFELRLAVERHEDMTLISSVIDSAEGVSFLTENGQQVHQITYQVRNSWKQFLEVTLPPRAALWSAFVDGRPVKPSAGEGGRVLIPLQRSLGRGRALSAFPVEVVYYEQQPGFGFLGRSLLQFPVPDVTVSRLEWSVYTPPEASFNYFGRDLEKVRLQGRDVGVGLQTIRGLAPTGQKQAMIAAKKPGRYRQSGIRDRMDRDMPLPASEEMDDLKDVEEKKFKSEAKDDDGYLDESISNLAASSPAPVLNRSESVVSKLLIKSGFAQVAGVLPVRVRIPTEGRVQQFAKVLPEKGFVALPLYYLSAPAKALLKGLLFVLFLFGLYAQRQRIQRLAQKYGPMLRSFYTPLQFLATPFRLMALFAALSLVGAQTAPWLLALSLLGFLAATAWWIFTLVRIPQKGA